MPDEFELSRRKVLGAVGGIGVASAGAGLGTTAYFNDTESFQGNSMTAGELDLKVGWQQTYTGPNPLNGGAVETHPVNAYPDGDGDGVKSTSGIIYGVEFDDELYAVDLEEGEAVKLSDTQSASVPPSPNGLAYDPTNDRLYYSVVTNSGTELYFYDVGSMTNVYAGDLDAEAAGAGWYDDRYWYVMNETDDLNAVSFNPDGTIAGETTVLADLTDNDRQYRFGDIAITPDGVLYASTLGSGGSMAEFFTVDIPGGIGTYTELYTGNEGAWSGDRDPTGLQLALDQEGNLYGEDAGSGEFYEIDVANETVTSVTSVDDLRFTDITNREETFLICTRPGATEEDFSSEYYPDQTSLVNLNDVKPGDKGEITFSLRLCDNPGYLWLLLDNFSESPGATTEPEPEPDDGELAESVMVRLWYDEDCDNQYDDGEQPIFSPGIGGYTAFDGGNAATLAEAVSVIQGNGGRIPLDGQAPFIDYTAGETSSDRDCLPGQTQFCIGLEWWIPTEVENEIQGDSVEFDLGFYTEQCRHNDGSYSDS